MLIPPRKKQTKKKTNLFTCRLNSTCFDNLLFFAQIKTVNLDHFEEVTAGTDMLFSIPTVDLDHQGTYQCEIYSEQLSVVRLYYYLSGTSTHKPQEKGNCRKYFA